MKGIAAIKQYFESGEQGRKVTMGELRDLSKQERRELAEGACEELGVEYEAPEDE
jgi:hypothetical protein